VLSTGTTTTAQKQVIVIKSPSPSRSPSHSPMRFEPCFARRFAVCLAHHFAFALALALAVLKPCFARRFAVCLAHRFARASHSHMPRASFRTSLVELPLAVLASRSPSSSPLPRTRLCLALVREFRLLPGKREEKAQPATTGACNFRSNFELQLSIRRKGEEKEEIDKKRREENCRRRIS